MSIKTIVSDVGDTLIQIDASRFYRAMADVYRTSPEAIEAFSKGTVRAFSCGEMTTAELSAKFKEHFGVDPENGALERAWTAPRVGFTPAKNIIHRVRRRYGLRLISCTDVDPISVGFFDGPNLLDGFFDAEVMSFRVGALKPDPRMYREALRLAACAPAECLFIDDREPNVHGARQHGMQAIHYVPGNPLYFKRKLAEHGLILKP